MKFSQSDTKPLLLPAQGSASARHIMRGVALWFGVTMLSIGLGIVQGQGMDALVWGIGMGFIVGSVSVIFDEVIDFVLEKAERWLNIDINRDGRIGTPIIDPGHIVIRGANVTDMAAAKAERDRKRFAEFVHGCASNTTWEYWEKLGWSEADWARARDFLMAAGYARWLNEEFHTQGWALTKAPDEIMSQVETWT